MHFVADGLERGLFLKVWLVLAGLSNSWGSLRNAMIYKDLVDHSDPRFPHWPFLALSVLSAVAVVGVHGCLRRSWWGLPLFAACWLVAAGLQLSVLPVSVWGVLPGFVSVVIVAGLLGARESHPAGA